MNYISEFVIDPPFFDKVSYTSLQEEAKQYNLTKENHDFLRLYFVYEEEYNLELLKTFICKYFSISMIFPSENITDFNFNKLKQELNFELKISTKNNKTIYVFADSTSIEVLNWFKSKIELFDLI